MQIKFLELFIINYYKVSGTVACICSSSSSRGWKKNITLIQSSRPACTWWSEKRKQGERGVREGDKHSMPRIQSAWFTQQVLDQLLSWATKTDLPCPQKNNFKSLTLWGYMAHIYNLSSTREAETGGLH